MLLRPAAEHRGPRPAPIAFSLAAHLSLLAMVAFGPAAPRKRQSAYQREIAPFEKKLVWYRFNEKLPDVAPPKREAARKPARAEAKHAQTIASRSPRKDPVKQMTLGPAPELKMEPELAAPNLIAFEPPKPPPAPKLFTPPPEVLREITQPMLENAPELIADARNPLLNLPAAPVAKPAPKAFVPPAQVARRTDAPRLEPGAMRIETALPNTPLVTGIPVLPKPSPKAFTSPQPVKRAAAATALEAAPAAGAQPPGSMLLAGVQPQLPPKPGPKRFTPPASSSTASNRPSAPAIETAPAVTAAIVGLNPLDRAAPRMPEVSRPAEFSAAPEISRKGDAPAAAEGARITVPDLTIRSGLAPKEGPKKDSLATIARSSPRSNENILAAVRPLIAARSATPPPSASPAARVSAGPDPRFQGRMVYTVVLQMPNVTSYSGSWILWYAERKAEPGEQREVTPPTPLRKVDPIYDLTAVDDRIEGKVQLSAIIHTDGYVYGINVLSGVDPRLDNNAITALRKWQFEPARREGTPVDVDVVIEIPFRLRPLLKK